VHSHTSNLLVAFLTIVTLITLTGFQVTSETSSVRLLGRLGSALVELDRWLPAHREDIKLLARDRPNQPLVLSELPVDVAIPAATALDAPLPVLKASITEAMGHRLYESGYHVIRDEQGESHLGFMEPLRWAVSGLDSGAHAFWRIALAVAGIALLVVCAGHFWARQSPLPGVAVGSAIATILALGVWLLLKFLGSSVDGALDREIASVAVDGIWIGLRNSLAATAIGLGALYAYNSFVGPRPRDDWDEWDDFDYEGYEPEPRGAPPPY
jgi:hypothetical protein